MTGSNRRPSACKADALPTELITQRTKCYLFSILSQVQGWLKKINGGTDGTRTRDPQGSTVEEWAKELEEVFDDDHELDLSPLDDLTITEHDLAKVGAT